MKEEISTSWGPLYVQTIMNVHIRQENSDVNLALAIFRKKMDHTDYNLQLC